MLTITKAQARRYLLLWQGLAGGHKFRGKAGALAFVRQAGCIQFDPIDVCGRSPELTLLSRVQGYKKSMLEELLYTDRALIDYFDKNLAILPLEIWPYFARERAWHAENGRSHQEVNQAAEAVKAFLQKNGPCCAQELPFDLHVDWYWSATSLSRAVLESLYFRGELIVHHKKGSIKYYDLAERYLPSSLLTAPDPCPDAAGHSRFLALRRVAAVGLLWNRSSDAWLGVPDFQAAARNAAFDAWEKAGSVIKLTVEGLREPMYLPAQALPTLERAIQDPCPAPRCEVIAPLDSFLWDRKLIAALFDFDYKWEVYTPLAQRKYGYYVLPLLRGERFIGRVEATREENALTIRHLWLERDAALTPTARRDVEACLHRLARLNDRETVKDEKGFLRP